MSTEGISFIFAPEKLDRMFKQFHTKYKRRVSKDNNGLVLEIDGDFMKLSDIQNEMDTTGVYEIRIMDLCPYNSNFDLDKNFITA
jgi:hypothetical protein